MAVEVKRVIGRLRALFPKANLTKERLNAIAERLAKKPEDGADDAAIDVVINEFNDNSLLSIEDIAREDDRQRNIQAKLDKLTAGRGNGQEDEEEEEEEEDPGQNPKQKKAPKDDDAPAWAKVLMQKVENIEKGKITDSKKQTATQLFEASETLKGLKPELKRRWLDRINVDSETSIEDQILGLEEEFSELVQISADSGDYAGAPPAFNKRHQETKISTDQADSIVGEMGI